jgi:hypothetical protein
MQPFEVLDALARIRRAWRSISTVAQMPSVAKT